MHRFLICKFDFFKENISALSLSIGKYFSYTFTSITSKNFILALFFF